MPDWITHIIVAWTLCTILGFKYKQFNQQNIAIVMVGALIPDIYKLYLIVSHFGIQMQYFLTPIHLPAGSILIACLISLFFVQRRLILFFLILGYLPIMHLIYYYLVEVRRFYTR